MPFLRAAAPLFGGGNLSPGEREDRANRWIIAAFGLIGLLMAYVPAFTDRKDFWPFGCLALFSSPPVVRCGSGQSLCSGVVRNFAVRERQVIGPVSSPLRARMARAGSR